MFWYWRRCLKESPPLPGCLRMGFEFLMKSRFCKNNLPLRGRYLGQVGYKFGWLMQINEHWVFSFKLKAWRIRKLKHSRFSLLMLSYFQKVTAKNRTVLPELPTRAKKVQICGHVWDLNCLRLWHFFIAATGTLIILRFYRNQLSRSRHSEA